MTRRAVLLLILPSFSLGASAAPAAGPVGDCAVLDQLLADAKTDFPSLKSKGFGGARCSWRSREYKCAFYFSTDRFAEAETQKERLERCTAALPHTQKLPAKRHEAAFRINPETSVFIRGPNPDNGYWTIELKIDTTADWD